jgi:hypothetical protein
MNLEKLMSMIGGEGDSEEYGGDHMEKMKKAHKLLKKATDLIGQCCGEEDDMEEDDMEEDDGEESAGKVMPMATTFVIQKSKR